MEVLMIPHCEVCKLLKGRTVNEYIKDVEDTTFEVVRSLSVPTIQERIRVREMTAQDCIEWSTTNK